MTIQNTPQPLGHSPNAWAQRQDALLQFVRSTLPELLSDNQLDLHKLKAWLPKLYSQDLLNNLFRHPYTRIEFVQNDLGVTRQTAAKYLKQLAEKGFVQEQAKGKHLYFINTPLVELLTQ